MPVYEDILKANKYSKIPNACAFGILSYRNGIDYISAEDDISVGDYVTVPVLEQIPRKIVTQELCDRVVEKSIWSLKWVPDEFVTKEMLMRVAVIALGHLSDNFPERLRTK